MKKTSIKIRERSTGIVTSSSKQVDKMVEHKGIAPLKKKEALVSPTFLFGKWKSIVLDAKELRRKAWDRSHKMQSVFPK